MKRTIGAVLLVVGLLATFARAEIKLVPVDYTEGGTDLQGYLAYDDAVTTPRPGVLVVQEWWGVNDYPKMRARQLAELGYVAFAADMYGKGKVTDDPKQAGEWAGPLIKDRAKMRARVTAGLEELKKQKQVDANKIAAIGYCFGGTAVLELARSGADLAGVVVFHGGLSSPLPAVGEIKPKILVCTGADDPNVKIDQIVAFEAEMKALKADAQVNIYPFAVHAFTNPNADKHHIPGVGYNEQADKRSWQAMKDFLAETIGK